jgi:hypothetical protein
MEVSGWLNMVAVGLSIDTADTEGNGTGVLVQPTSTPTSRRITQIFSFSGNTTYSSIATIHGFDRIVFTSNLHGNVTGLFAALDERFQTWEGPSGMQQENYSRVCSPR